MTSEVKEKIVHVSTDKRDQEILEEFLDNGWKLAGGTVFVPTQGADTKSTLFCVLNKKQ